MREVTFCRNSDGEKGEKEEERSKKCEIQFDTVEGEKMCFLETFEVRLSDRGDTRESKQDRESEGLRYNTKILQCCRKFVCTWKCTMQNADHKD